MAWAPIVSTQILFTFQLIACNSVFSRNFFPWKIANAAYVVIVFSMKDCKCCLRCYCITAFLLIEPDPSAHQTCRFSPSCMFGLAPGNMLFQLTLPHFVSLVYAFPPVLSHHILSVATSSHEGPLQAHFVILAIVQPKFCRKHCKAVTDDYPWELFSNVLHFICRWQRLSSVPRLCNFTCLDFEHSAFYLHHSGCELEDKYDSLILLFAGCWPP